MHFLIEMLKIIFKKRRIIKKYVFFILNESNLLFRITKSALLQIQA